MRGQLVGGTALGAVGLALSISAAEAPPSTYVVEFVSTAARGVAMNDMGAVVGVRGTAPTCSGCTGGSETVVWPAGSRLVGGLRLPEVPGRPALEVHGISAAGWVVGAASPGYPGIDSHAVVWKPVRGSYQAIDLGVLPGTTLSTAIGIDASNRVVGYSVTQTFPPSGAPFLWTEADGMLDLTSLGFPNESPLAISPGGTVALSGSWYRLDDPGSVTPMAPPPQGFFPAGMSAINDAGDGAAFLLSTSGQNLAYLFRYHHEGGWQLLSSAGTGHLSRFGVGGITSGGDVSATVQSTAVIAYGPDGLAEPLAARLSPAYQGNDVTTGGPITAAGSILAQVMIGRSPRLVRLLPAEPCLSGCATVPILQLLGEFVPDPNDPGHCTANAFDLVVASLRVLDEAADPVPGARVVGRFLDDYWLDHVVTATTDELGGAGFRHRGPACVGAIAFLVTGVTKPGTTLDRTTGSLTDFVIPLP